RLNERFGSKRLVAGGLTVAALGLTILATCNEHTSYWHIALGLAVMSAGIVCTMVPATDSIMGSLPREKAGVGSAVNDTTRQVGGALGVAVIGSVVASVYSANIASVAPSAGLTGTALETSKGSLGGALDTAGSLGAGAAGFVQDAKVAFVDALSSGLRIGALVIFAAAVVSYFFLPARARAAQ